MRISTRSVLTLALFATIATSSARAEGPPSEARVAPTESLAAQLALAEIVVQRQPAVFEEASEGNAVVARIADGLGNRRLVQHQRSLLVAPSEKGIANWLGLHLADAKPLL